VSTAVRRAAVLGSPIGHSMSPLLHRAAYAELGLPWRYDAVEVDEAGLAPFLDGLSADWAGLSLTMPLKRAVLPLLDWCSNRARAVEAVNTVVLTRGRRLGTNTDIPGMVAALRERGVGPVLRATVLGGGATAASALAALAELGVTTPAVVVRRPEATADLAAVARRLGQDLRVRRWADAADELAADVVVQTAPAGAADELAAVVPTGAGTLFEVVYDPWPTPLAAAWQQAGGAVLGGLDLLVHQAVLQVRLMTGFDAPQERLLGCMRAALPA
jgi:shikimate dehydrogenase